MLRKNLASRSARNLASLVPTLVRDLLVSVNDSDLVQGLDIGRQTPVYAQHLVLHDLKQQGRVTATLTSPPVRTRATTVILFQFFNVVKAV